MVYISLQGYYTLDTRCEFTSNQNGLHLEINRLKKVSTNTVRCLCDVVSLSSTGQQHATVAHNFLFEQPILTCSLTIVRCPLRISLQTN